MKTLLLSAFLAVLTEALLVVALFTFGTMGPCGPTNDIAGVVLAIHSPGIMLASELHLFDGFTAIVLGIGSVIFGLTILYCVILTALRLFLARSKSPNSVGSTSK